MSSRCYSSLITLIPKVDSPIVVIYLRRISLIGAHYKIIMKVLASRFAKVIDSIVSHEQSTCVTGLQILDGPRMVNRIVDWFKKCKRKLMIFKINFEMAYVSIS